MEPSTLLALTAMGAVGGAVSAPPAGPSTAAAGTIGGAGFDNSGWNITFGNDSGIKAERTDLPKTSGYMQYVIVGVVGLLAWRWLKKS